VRRLVSPSRWISVIGLAVGIFFLLFRFFVDGRSLFRAFVEAASASFAAMVVGGVAHRFWGGAQVLEASAGPSGAAVKFIRSARPPVRDLAEEWLGDLELINERLLALEKAVDELRAAQPPAEG
jgi:hypothetical protein